MYHFVWIPKYRHKVFEELYRTVLKDIVELEIPADHIHMEIRSEPKVSPSDVMQVVKSISAREFFRVHLEVKKKYFWGGKLWTQSYFVETIGNASEEVIRKYVQDQLKAMDNGEKYGSQLIYGLMRWGCV